MKQILLGLAVCLVFAAGPAEADEAPVWEDTGAGAVKVRALAFGPESSRRLYYGSNQGVFVSKDDGRNWSVLLYLSGADHAVTRIMAGAGSSDSVCAATTKGLFYSGDRGKTWKRIFAGKNRRESYCTSLALMPSVRLIGTQAGLFVSKSTDGTWHRQQGALGDEPIQAIAFDTADPDTAYVASAAGVFKTDDQGVSWHRVFPARVQKTEILEEAAEDGPQEAAEPSVCSVSIDPRDRDHVCLATQLGVYESRDKGKSWTALSGQGLLERDVRIVTLSPEGDLYAVTKTAVYVYRNDKWDAISQRLIAGTINDLAAAGNGLVLVASEKGCFRSTVLRERTSGLAEAPGQAAGEREPDIRLVQQAAIRYAEVSPEKIQQWRKACAQKAWLPQVSVGVDRDASDLWHWETGSATRPNDDSLRKGDDTFAWDVRLCWDFSDLVWNNDQTAIDVRSKLMVELRQDIVDEVTKIYFERLRVRMEIGELGLAEVKKRKEKELRLRELTAYLDGLTGGYVSAYAAASRDRGRAP